MRVGQQQEGSARGGALTVFRVPNFSLYFSGQLISNTGMWFQNLAISMIVLERTGSASALALVSAAQFGPLLIFAAPAGRLADRFSPRSVLMVTSITATLAAGVLAWGVADRQSPIALLYVLVAVGGAIAAVERVAAQAFVFELVGADLLKNAVVLSTMYVSAARSIGPGLAGLAYLGLGPAICLLINAASYLVVFVSLLFIRPAALHPRRTGSDTSLSFLQTLRTVRGSTELTVVLIVNATVTFAAMNMNVVLTTAVLTSFGSGAGELGLLHALNAIGAVVGGYLLTRVESITAATLGPSLLVFSVTLALSGLAPSLLWFVLVAPLLGVGVGLFQGVVQSAAQLASPPAMLGRVMSLVTLSNYGVAPFGAIVIGVLIDATSPQTALGVGSLATAGAALFVFILFRVRSRNSAPGNTRALRAQSRDQRKELP